MSVMLIANNETRESGSFMGDRDYFGAWLSGFTDGEGCFRLDSTKQNGNLVPKASFHIGLREDDSYILYLIQSFLCCGVIVHNAGNRKARNPQTRFVVRTVSDLWNIVVPQFDRYPLLAKKKDDFGLWRKGIEILYAVTSVPMKSNGIYGRLPRWNEQNTEEFFNIQDALEQQRIYRESVQ